MAELKYYLHIPGVLGDSKDGTHPAWITLLSLSLPVYRPSASGGTSSGVPRGAKAMDELHVTVSSGAATASLQLLVMDGTVSDEVWIDIVRAKGSTILMRWKLVRVRVTSYQYVAGADGHGGTDIISLSFEKMKIENYEKGAKEVEHMSWNVRE